MAAADGPAVIGGKGGAADLGGVPFVNLDLLAGGQVPEAHGQVARPGQEALLVGRQGDAPDAVGVTQEPANLLAARDVPHADAPVLALRGPAAAADGPLAVPGEQAADDRAPVAVEPAEL